MIKHEKGSLIIPEGWSFYLNQTYIIAQHRGYKVPEYSLITDIFCD